MKNFIPIIALALLASNVDASHHFQSKSIETFSDVKIIDTIN